MAKKSTALAGIFDDEPEPVEPAPMPAPERQADVAEATRPAPGETAVRPRAKAPAGQGGASRNHGSKKPVLIHIPDDMHKMLRRISVEEGEPLTAITERMLRQYLVAKGHTKFAPKP